MIETFTLFGQHKSPRYICQELKNDMIMAKQRGPVFIEGTIDGRTYYKLNGKYYVRKKSSLSARRVKRTPAFKRTMAYAGWMAGASVIASAIYWRLPEKEKKRKRYQALTGEAMRLLRDGVDEATVRAKLEAAHLQKEVASTVDVKPVVCEAELKAASCAADAKPEEKLPMAPAMEAPLAVVRDEQLGSITGKQSSAERAFSIDGKQRSDNQVKGRSIAIIPVPVDKARRLRVLRYKTKPRHGCTPQKKDLKGYQLRPWADE